MVEIILDLGSITLEEFPKLDKIMNDLGVSWEDYIRAVKIPEIQKIISKIPDWKENNEEWQGGER